MGQQPSPRVFVLIPDRPKCESLPYFMCANALNCVHYFMCRSMFTYWEMFA